MSKHELKRRLDALSLPRGIGRMTIPEAAAEITALRAEVRRLKRQAKRKMSGVSTSGLKYAGDRLDALARELSPKNYTLGREMNLLAHWLWERAGAVRAPTKRKKGAARAK